MIPSDAAGTAGSEDSPYQSPEALLLDPSLTSADTVIVRRVSPSSLAKVGALLGGSFGALAGVLFTITSLAALIPTLWSPDASHEGFPSVAFGLAVLLVGPVVYGLLGAVGGWALARLYNVVSTRFGGLEVTIERPLSPTQAVQRIL